MRATLLGRTADDELAQFSCCPDDSPGHISAVQKYLAVFAQRQSAYVLGLRDENGTLVGVSAFDETTVKVLPVLNPTEVRGWHLDAVGIALSHQRRGYSKLLFDETFSVMHQLDPSRSLVVASVHYENEISIAACAAAGLEPYLPAEGEREFHELVGVVPGTSPPHWLE